MSDQSETILAALVQVGEYAKSLDPDLTGESKEELRVVRRFCFGTANAVRRLLEFEATDRARADEQATVLQLPTSWACNNCQRLNAADTKTCEACHQVHPTEAV